MAWWSRLFTRKDGASPLTEMPAGFRWPVSRSGYEVSALGSLQVATVMACVRAISEGVAQVPIYVHSRDDRGMLGPRRPHPVLDVITRRPNAWQSGFEFRECLLLHLALVGNAFVYVSRSVTGQILELIPIEPGRVFVTRERDMSLTYRVTFEDGTAPIVPVENMWHIRGPSWNTWMGLDAVKYARESIGLAIATEAQHAALHKGGARTNGLLSMPNKLSAENLDQLSKWLDRHAVGGDREGKPMIVDNGTKFENMTMTGMDAQHIETRKHQVMEICAHFRVQPMMVGAVETPTYASVEQLQIHHVVHTLTPWAERIEQSSARVLFGEDERLELRHDFNGLMRGASADRATFYTKALGAGGHGAAWMTPNEVRREEGLDPIEGNDDIPKPAAPAPAPAAAPVEPDEDDNEDTAPAAA